MNPALLITLASVLIGGVLAALTSRGHALLDGLRTFAVTAVAALAAVQLLPESVEHLGAWALLLFVGALALPPLFAAIARRLRGPRVEVTAHGVGAELGYFGFVAHQFVEGLALAAYADPQRYDHDHVELVLAVAAHTVPMTALFIGTVLLQRGRRPAIRRVLALLAASGAGFLTAGWVTHEFADALAPTLAAVVAGFLCHVLLHGIEGAGRRTTSVRLIDLAAVAAGLALPLASVHSHSPTGEAMHSALAGAWTELALETAPMLLLGLVLGAVLQVIGGRLPTQWLHAGSPSRQAWRGIAIGVPLPLCACGVLPIAEGLRGRGAPAALVVAFLIATPELGPETVTLTVRFLGWPYAILRVVAALLLAYVAGLVFARLVDRGRVATPVDRGHVPDEPEIGGARGLAGALAHFDELLLHTAPWTVVGLLAAAYIDISFPAAGLAGLAATGLDVFVIALVALPAYVCAASATPMAAVLVLKGVSPGAVLVGLLLGPATNVATVAVLGRAYGGRATWIGVAVIAGVSCGLGLLVNVVGVPVALPLEVGEGHGHGIVAWGAIGVLGGLLVGQLWRWGLGPWLGVLDAGSHAHGHAHDHVHGHDHGHVHDHVHDQVHDHDHDHGRG